MKKTHIAALIMVALAAVFMFMSLDDMSTFSTFADAAERGHRVKIAGTLSKTDPMHYDPEVDANFFSFYMIDENKDKHKVVIRKPKQQDFERSEQIVVTGKMNTDDNVFEASEMLLKCPSKYKDEEIALRKQALAN